MTMNLSDSVSWSCVNDGVRMLLFSALPYRYTKVFFWHSFSGGEEITVSVFRGVSNLHQTFGRVSGGWFGIQLFFG